jgi:hypothetical protein
MLGLEFRIISTGNDKSSEFTTLNPKQPIEQKYTETEEDKSKLTNRLTSAASTLINFAGSSFLTLPAVAAFLLPSPLPSAFMASSFLGAESDPEMVLLSSDDNAAASDAAAPPAGAGGVSAPSWMVEGWGSAMLCRLFGCEMGVFGTLDWVYDAV